MKNITLIFCVFMLLSACVNFRHDITDNRKAWYPYEVGRKYILREDVFLMKVDGGMEPKRLALVPVSSNNRGSGFHSSPNSIEEYERDPVEASKKHHEYGYYEVIVKGIARKGTTFTPSRIMRNAGWNLWFGNHTNNTLYGEITSGPFQGVEVDIEDISWCIKDENILNQYVINSEQ
ncbi:MAG: hypothetical protein GY793_00815 [Proteobacteria bacterium]|nr:hypothetical protein [Pseudomonadota bacterium]